MQSELIAINAIINNNDMAVVMAADIDTLFTGYQDVWQGIKSYYDRYRALPSMEVLQGRFKQLDRVETPGPTQYYLDNLREEYINSNVSKLIKEAATSLGKKEPAGKIAETMLISLAEMNRFTDAVRDIDVTDIDAAIQHYEETSRKSLLMGGSPGIPLGIDSIDQAYTTGMAGGHLIVVIGWPGRMKSWFTNYILCNAWASGFTPMIVSLEMSPETIRDRLYTMMGSGLFRNSDLVRGNVNFDDIKTWGQKKFEQMPPFHVVSSEGMGAITPGVVEAKIDKYKPDLVLLDYHQLFEDNAHSKNEVERNKRLSRELKQLAVNKNIPVIDITAATDDQSGDRESPPMLRNVAWSKAIEYDADMGFAVHRHTDTNIVEVVSRKNRHGGDFCVYLDWDVDKGIIKEGFERP